MYFRRLLAMAEAQEDRYVYSWGRKQVEAIVSDVMVITLLVTAHVTGDWWW